MDYLFFHSTYIIKELSFIIRCNLMWKYYGVKMKRKSMWKIFCNRGKNNNTYYQIALSNFTRTSLLQTSQNEQLRLCYANGRRSILRLGWIFIVAYVKRSLLLSFSTLFFFHEYVFKILQKIKYAIIKQAKLSNISLLMIFFKCIAFQRNYRKFLQFFIVCHQVILIIVPQCIVCHGKSINHHAFSSFNWIILQWQTNKMESCRLVMIYYWRVHSWRKLRRKVRSEGHTER